MKKIFTSVMLLTIFAQSAAVEHFGFATVNDSTSVKTLERTKQTVYEAANGTFWLTKNERKSLRDKGFNVSYLYGLSGWEKVESTGTMFKDRITCQVNNPQGKRATIQEIKAVLDNHLN